MDRKFVIALSSLAGSILLTEAHAIGLGDIKLRTSLNEPLRADIQLVQVKDLSENEILVNLASQTDFSKAGVDRDFLLTSLRFRVDMDDPKNPKVVVTTEQPIREPYLNFLVELQWPSGRLLREYTLLMDLPAFADTAGGSSRSIKGTHVPSGVAQPPDGGVSEMAEEPVAPPPVKTTQATVAAEPEADVQEEPAAAAEPAPAEEEVSRPAEASSSGGVVKVRRATREEIENYRQAPVAPAAEAPVEQPVAEEPAAAPEEPVAKTAEEAGAEPELATEQQESAPAPAAEEEAPAAGADQYGPTDSKDTLWRIAQQARPSGSSIHQTMVAIQRMNPQAFANGNINKLKRGQVLQLPSEADIASIAQADAVADYERQVAEWSAQAAKTTAPPLDASGQAAATAPTAPAVDGQLTLAAPATETAADAKAGQGTGGKDPQVAALEGQLTTSMEELNRVQREHQDVASRAQELDSQLTNAERLLELQSAELAAMQAKLAEEERLKAEAAAKAQAEAAAAQAAADAKAKADADAAAAAAAEKAAADKAAADAQLAAQQQAAQPPADAATAQAPAPAAEAPPAEAPVAAAPEQPAVEAPAAVEPAADKPAPAPAPEIKPVLKQEAAPVAVEPEAEGLPAIVTTGIAGVVAFILALFGYRKIAARKQAAAAAAEEEYTPAEYEPAAEYEQPSSVATTEVDLELGALEQESAAGEAEELVPVAEEAPRAESGDVLGEADIYISFGNFDKGQALLEGAIRNEPGRADFRLKLLELHKEAGNLAAFDEAYKGLIELDDDEANARAGQLRSKIPGADATPFAFGVASAAASAGISNEFDLDLDMDLGLDAAPAPAPVEETAPVAETAGFDLDFDLDAAIAQTPAEEPAPVAETAEFDLDFDLDAAIAETPVVEEPEVAEAGLDLDFDLDLAQAEPVAEPAPVEVAAVAPVAEVSADDLALDFDLDLGLDESAAAQPAASIATSDTAIRPAVSADADADAADILGAVAADSADLDEDLDFLSDTDEAATKLDLARAYIDMGDKDGARDILQEVLDEGGDEQKREAKGLLDSLG